MVRFGMREPIAYVIAFEKDDGGRSYHGSSIYDGQAVLRYYPSPFDALIDIWYSVRANHQQA